MTYSNKVEGAVQATANVRNIDVKSELVAEELKHLVLVLALHEVHAGADVGAVPVLGDVFEAEGVAVGLDAIGALVVNTVEATRRGAGLAVGADAGVPAVPLVAVGGALDGVPCNGKSVLWCNWSEGDLRPSPVAVEDHGAGDVGAAAAGAAARPVELRLGLLGRGAGLLGLDDAQDEG